MIGQVSFSRPAYPVMGKLYRANSVNPKPFRHGNTELNSEISDKCVENINSTSLREDDVFRTLWKHKESHRNGVVAYQNGYVVTDCVMLMMVNKRSPLYSVTDKVHPANSVNPKPSGYGNTELSSEKSDKCEETRYGTSFYKKDEGIVRTIWKRIELIRNVLADIKNYIVTDNLGRHRYDLISGRTWHCHLPLREHHWLEFY